MALCSSDAEIDMIHRALVRLPDSRTLEQISALQRLTSAISAFSNLPHESHVELCRYMTLKSARKNAVIVKEGDSADCMHVPFFLAQPRRLQLLHCTV
jgi:hypothetical protein